MANCVSGLAISLSHIIGQINWDGAIANHQIIVTPRQGKIRVIVTPPQGEIRVIVTSRQGEAFRYKYSGEMQRLSPECFAPNNINVKKLM